MGILRDFINAMRRPSFCEGCGRQECNRDCAAARRIEQDWQDSIK